jgi:hypothetical protein
MDQKSMDEFKKIEAKIDRISNTGAALGKKLRIQISKKSKIMLTIATITGFGAFLFLWYFAKGLIKKK